MEIPMRRLIRKIDNDGNSILHMIGRKPNDHFDEDMRSPALILQEDLLLFESSEEDIYNPFHQTLQQKRTDCC
ncbi:unnamed protein product [Camellia sinensis]